jgi:hypothetical protein
MPVAVFKMFDVVDGHLIEVKKPPSRSRFKWGDVAGALAALGPRGDGPKWKLYTTIGTGPGAREMAVQLQPFLTTTEYGHSMEEPWPLPLSELRLENVADPTPRWLWLYRDGIYVAERNPRASELGETALRIKAIHFQGDIALRRLREQVANFEAIGALKAKSQRRSLPDDVKLVVWARDGGACVKCGATKELQFDHVIPLARGGSDTGDNIQILCQTCNLAKGDRLV